MLARAIVIALLAALPLGAVDIPLSDRPLAPLPAGFAAASAGSDSVLVAFAENDGDVYVQRVRLDGSPLDPTATFIGHTSWLPAITWNGQRWVVVLSEPLRALWVEPSGQIDGPFDLGMPDGRLGMLVMIEGRVVLGASASGTLYFLAEPNLLVAIGLFWAALPPRATASGFAFAWVEGGPGLVLWKPRGAVVSFSVVTEGRYIETRSVAWCGGSWPTCASWPTFIASEGGGGLLLWDNNGLRGMIVRSDGTFSAELQIGPPGVASGDVIGTPRPGGWNLLFESAWGLPRTTSSATVDHDGSSHAVQLETAVDLRPEEQALVSQSFDNLLVVPRPAPAAGLDVIKIAGARAEPPVLIGYGAASQYGARSASGAGLDLVVWEEQTRDGIALKATLVNSIGLPLSGKHLVIEPGIPTRPSWRLAHGDLFDVAFDGETFVVAWMRDRERYPRSAMFRRVTIDGKLLGETFLGYALSGSGITVTGAGEGRSAVAWHTDETTTVLVPVAREEVGPMVQNATGIPSTLPRLAASRDRFLAVFNEYHPVCRITCAPIDLLYRPHARLFALDGTPLGEPLPLPGWNIPHAVSDGIDFYVVDGMDLTRGRNVVRLDANLLVIANRSIARPGVPSIHGAELRVDQEITRAVYSLSGDLLRFEPLPLRGREKLETALSGDRIVAKVPEGADRLVIRALAHPPPPVADLAVVPVGAMLLSDGWFKRAAFRIEHRGGDPVTRIELWTSQWDADIVAHPLDDEHRLTLLLDRELRHGDSLTIRVRYQDPDVTLGVAGDAVDLEPSNNLARFQGTPKARRRPAIR